MVDVVIIAILVAVVGLACMHIYKAKKSGRQCMGCPSSGTAACHCKKK